MFATAREAATQETKDEYRRLLYVAMTRAAQRLVIAGYRPGNSNEIDPHSWYALMRGGLEASGLDAQTIETDDGPVRRFRKAGDKDLRAVAATGSAQTCERQSLMAAPARQRRDRTAPMGAAVGQRRRRDT